MNWNDLTLPDSEPLATHQTAANEPKVGIPQGAATTVGGYLRDLSPDRRVAMARICSMIRRSARGVRESMRYGLAFYELDGPLFALRADDAHLILFLADASLLEKYQIHMPSMDIDRSAVYFADLNRIPLEALERLVRECASNRRNKNAESTMLSLTQLLSKWKIEADAIAHSFE